MPLLLSEPPQLVASVISETGCFDRWAAFAMGRSLATSIAAFSTVFLIPPASWMLMTMGLRSGCPGAAMRCLSTMTAA